MTWQGRKEGFARSLENRMRERLGLAENTGGPRMPCSRISSYYVGDRLLRLLQSRDKAAAQDIELLCAHIFWAQP